MCVTGEVTVMLNRAAMQMKKPNVPYSPALKRYQPQNQEEQ